MVSTAEKSSGATASVPTPLTEPRPVRRILIGLALAHLGLFLVVPLVAVFVKAMEKGLAVYRSAISDPTELAAIRLTAMTAAIAGPLNVLFGLAASYGVAVGEALQAQAHQMLHCRQRVRGGTLAHPSFASCMRPIRREVEWLLETGQTCGLPKTEGAVARSSSGVRPCGQLSGMTGVCSLTSWLAAWRGQPVCRRLPWNRRAR